MTRQRHFGNDTPFCAWMRAHPRLPSSGPVFGFTATDSDVVVHRYKAEVDGVGTRDMQAIMQIEVKTSMSQPKPSQLDTLMRLNGLRFILYDDWDRILHPLASRVTRWKKIPAWLVLAGIHGEYELVFTVSTSKEREFLAAAKRIGWNPLLIGEVTEGVGVSVKNSEGIFPLDTTKIRNLSAQAGSDSQAYVKELIQMAEASGIH